MRGRVPMVRPRDCSISRKKGRTTVDTIHSRIAHLLLTYAVLLSSLRSLSRNLYARLRPKTFRERRVLPIAAGDFHWQNPLLSQHEGL